MIGIRVGMQGWVQQLNMTEKAAEAVLSAPLLSFMFPETCDPHISLVALCIQSTEYFIEVLVR